MPRIDQHAPPINTSAGVARRRGERAKNISASVSALGL
jgi:hypothetical protein